VVQNLKITATTCITQSHSTQFDILSFISLEAIVVKTSNLSLR